MSRKKQGLWSILTKHMMTGVSYMIPVIAMGGLLQSIGILMGGVDVGNLETGLSYYIYNGGQLAMSLVVPVLAAYIAYSIADRPGIGPGFLVGLLSNEMGIGFIGGIIGGFLVGYFSKLIKDNIKVPEALSSLMALLVIPVLGGLFAILLTQYLLAPVLGGFQTQMILLFESMGTSSKFLFGATIGGLVGIDMAGPIGKIGTTVANGMLADGIIEPQGAKVAACMVPPLALGISSLLVSKNKYTKQEKAAGSSAIVLGLFQVTEGGLPFLLANPTRVIPATAIGAGLTGGLAMMWGVGSRVTMGGIAAFPAMVNVLYAILAVIIGVIVTVILLHLLKKDVEEDELAVEDALDDDLEITFE